MYILQTSGPVSASSHNYDTFDDAAKDAIRDCQGLCQDITILRDGETVGYACHAVMSRDGIHCEGQRVYIEDDQIIQEHGGKKVLRYGYFFG